MNPRAWRRGGWSLIAILCIGEALASRHLALWWLLWCPPAMAGWLAATNGRGAIWMRAATSTWRLWTLLIPDLLLTLVFCLALIYGWERGIHAPVAAPPVLGRSVSATATVVSVKPYEPRQGLPKRRVALGESEASRAVVSLQVTSVAPTGAGSVQSAFRATWWVSGTRTNAYATDDTLHLQGVFTTYSLAASQGAKPFSGYSFSGVVSERAPVHRTWAALVLEGLRKSLSYLGVLSPTENALAMSIVFGGEGVDANTKQAFLRAGLLHVMAASGANIGILLTAWRFCVEPWLRWVKLPASLQTAALVGSLWFFTCLCNSSPSIVRAATMMTYQEIGAYLGRDAPTKNALMVAALAGGIVSPTTLLSASSVLSFAATAAIVAAIRRPTRSATSQPQFRVARWTRPLWMHLRNTLRFTLAVELVMVPLTIFMFNQVTPYAVVSNLIAEPVLFILLPSVVALLPTAVAAAHFRISILSIVAQGMAKAVQCLIDILLWIVGKVANLPASLWQVNLPWWAAGILIVSSAGALVAVLHRGRRF